MELNNPEEFSKHLFGRKYRLSIWRAVISGTVEPPYTFLQSELALTLQQRIHLQPSTTYAELSTMHELGMIEPVDTYSGAPYVRTESPIWHIATAAIAASNELFPAHTE